MQPVTSIASLRKAQGRFITPITGTLLSTHGRSPCSFSFRLDVTMNEQERAELDQLRLQQDTLQTQVARLGERINQLSSRWNASAVPVPEMQPPEMGATESPALVLNEVLEDSPAARAETLPALPPPLPPVITERTAPRETSPPLEQVIAPSPSVPPIVAAPPVAGEAFEMKLGTYWLVRVGIVMLLTGMVFLGTYAYKNFIGKLGPDGKVVLLYTAGAALLTFGGWLQRKREKESLRNYGQVLFAGGLALVYFTTYAAHYVEQLRIISSPVVDALLLLGWSAVTVWIADRRKSEVLALFAIGLSYYTSAMTNVGLFTLYSNLLLAAAAVFFLLRHRWVALSFISLAATYGGFAFWRFHEGGNWAAALPQLWHGNFFLAGYWLFFTAAVFFARGTSLTHVNRALFASLNNGAFFGLTVLSMAPVAAGNFWKFALGFGTTLLATSVLARKILAAEPAIKNTYLVQGLVLVTAGSIAYFTGVKLALMLAAESAILIVLGLQQKNVFIRAGGWITGALSALWLALSVTGARSEIALAAAIGGAMLFNGWWERRHDPHRAASAVRPGSGYFVALAIVVWGFATWRIVPGPWLPVAWMIEAVVLVTAFYPLRLPEVPAFAQALTAASLARWFWDFVLPENSSRWPTPATFIGGTVLLAFLGHHQKSIFVRGGAYVTAAITAAWAMARMANSSVDLSLGAAMGAAFLMVAWWEHRKDELRATSVVRPLRGYFVALAIGVCGILTWRMIPQPWVPVAWMIEALFFTALFYALRLPELPLFAQGLCVAAQGFWFFEFALRQGRPHWTVPAVLVVGTLALSHWWQRQKQLKVVADFHNLLQIVYGLALVGVLFFWFQPGFGPAAWLAFLSLLAVGVTLYGALTRAWALAACAQLFLFISLVELFAEFGSVKPSWQMALVPLTAWLVLGLAATMWLARHDVRHEVRRPLLYVSTFYRGVAFAMSVWWIHAYVSAPNQFWTLCAAGLTLLGLSAWRRNVEALAFSGAFLGIAFAVWFISGFTDADVINWPNLLAIVAILAAQQIVRRTSRPSMPLMASGVIAAVASLALWLFVTRRVVLDSGGAHFFLTASWAGLAFVLFAAGFVLRERVYRWIGLGILACSVARVFLSDVWKLDALYRILSFMALGVVLLALGFIYNKYQEKIRQWL